jgi:hypothetical protein
MVIQGWLFLRMCYNLSATSWFTLISKTSSSITSILGNQMKVISLASINTC